MNYFVWSRVQKLISNLIPEYQKSQKHWGLFSENLKNESGKPRRSYFPTAAKLSSFSKLSNFRRNFQTSLGSFQLKQKRQTFQLQTFQPQTFQLRTFQLQTFRRSENFRKIICDFFVFLENLFWKKPSWKVRNNPATTTIINKCISVALLQVINLKLVSEYHYHSEIKYLHKI